MKLRRTNHIELSVANLKALMRRIEDGDRNPHIIKQSNGETFVVSVLADEDHYSEAELADRRSPYLPPEAWAGALP